MTENLENPKRKDSLFPETTGEPIEHAGILHPIDIQIRFAQELANSRIEEFTAKIWDTDVKFSLDSGARGLNIVGIKLYPSDKEISVRKRIDSDRRLITEIFSPDAEGASIFIPLRQELVEVDTISSFGKDYQEYKTTTIKFRCNDDLLSQFMIEYRDEENNAKKIFPYSENSREHKLDVDEIDSKENISLGTKPSWLQMYEGDIYTYKEKTYSISSFKRGSIILRSTDPSKRYEFTVSVEVFNKHATKAEDIKEA